MMDGGLLRTFRSECGWSQSELAAELSVSRETVSRYENGRLPVPELVEQRFNRLRRTRNPVLGVGRFRFIDLFAGIGGFRYAFEDVGGSCVFTCEWNKYARKTYEANFGVDHAFAEDITLVPVEAVPPHDVLLAGFPCQPFSIAGVSKKNSLGRPHGFADEAQGTLFFDIAQILRRHRPAAFLLENVKNLASHDKGNTLRVILRVLREDLGYQVDWKVLDAKSFVPQHRERVFLVGFRDPNDFSFARHVSVPDAKSGPRMSTILHPEEGSEAAEEPYTVGKSASVSDKYTLSDKLWDYLQAYAEKHRLKGNGFGFGMVGPTDVSRTLSARYYKDGSEILVRREGGNPRRLTPRECARLMGFDRGDRRVVIPVSDTQAYKQFGNAVSVPIVDVIARAMVPFLSDQKLSDQVEPELAGD